MLSAGGRKQTSWSRAGHSYCSQSENILTFGLGDAANADEIVVSWPSGKTSTLTNIAAGSKIVVKEAEASAAAAKAST